MKKGEPGASPDYTKHQLLHTARYAGRRDLVAGLLKEGNSYTLEEADSVIKKFMERKVR